jgi:hypothetical protein
MAERDHHTSKRRHFTVVLVPNEEASESRSYRFAPWQVRTLVAAAVSLVVGVMLALLYWTPLSGWLSLPNPAMENRYGKEIVALNQRMVTMMEQLLEMRSYNVQLRNALGDRSVADSMRRSGNLRPSKHPQSARFHLRDCRRYRFKRPRCRWRSPPRSPRRAM